LVKYHKRTTKKKKKKSKTPYYYKEFLNVEDMMLEKVFKPEPVLKFTEFYPSYLLFKDPYIIPGQMSVDLPWYYAWLTVMDEEDIKNMGIFVTNLLNTHPPKFIQLGIYYKMRDVTTLRKIYENVRRRVKSRIEAFWNQVANWVEWDKFTKEYSWIILTHPFGPPEDVSEARLHQYHEKLMTFQAMIDEFFLKFVTTGEDLDAFHARWMKLIDKNEPIWDALGMDSESVDLSPKKENTILGAMKMRVETNIRVGKESNHTFTWSGIQDEVLEKLVMVDELSSPKPSRIPIAIIQTSLFKYIEHPKLMMLELFFDSGPSLFKKEVTTLISVLRRKIPREIPLVVRLFLRDKRLDLLEKDAARFFKVADEKNIACEINANYHLRVNGIFLYSIQDVKDRTKDLPHFGYLKFILLRDYLKDERKCFSKVKKLQDNDLFSARHLFRFHAVEKALDQPKSLAYLRNEKWDAILSTLGLSLRDLDDAPTLETIQLHETIFDEDLDGY